MKRKQLKKRLTINKETISNLNTMTLNDLRGGITPQCTPGPFEKTEYVSCFGATCEESCFGLTCGPPVCQ